VDETERILPAIPIAEDGGKKTPQPTAALLRAAFLTEIHSRSLQRSRAMLAPSILLAL